MSTRAALLTGIVLGMAAACTSSVGLVPAASAANADLQRRAATTCTASADISWNIPADLEDQVAQFATGWLFPNQLYVGSLESLAAAVHGTYFGIDDGRGYVNALLPEGHWATYVATRADTTGEAWLVTIVRAVPCG